MHYTLLSAQENDVGCPLRWDVRSLRSLGRGTYKNVGCERK